MRGFVVLTWMMLAALAGCLSTQTPGGDAIVPPVAEVAFVSIHSVVDPQGGTGEPSVGVLADGTLFTNGDAHTGFPDPGAAYRSTDGGANWTQVGTPTAPFPNFDPDLAVDMDGNVWFDTLYIGCSTVSVSRDAGETWSMPNPTACTGPVGDRQYLIPTARGEAYIYFHQLPTVWQTGAKTTDYGQTWIPTGPIESPDHHTLVTEGSGWGGGGFWNPTTGSVFVTFTWSRGPLVGGGWAPAFSVTRDDGLTWQVIEAAQPLGAAVGLSLVVGAADEAGNVYLAWAEDLTLLGEDEGAMAVMVAASRDDGVTWSAPIRVDDHNGSKVFPAITAGAPGEVAIAFYESDEDAYPASVSDDATWNVTLVWTQDIFADAPTWENGTLSRSSVRSGPICPDGTTCGSNREFLDYFQVKRLPDGRVGGVWNSLREIEGTLVQVYGATTEPLLSPWHGLDMADAT